MNHENSLGPTRITWLKRARARDSARASPRSRASITSAPAKPPFIASMTPEENTGSMNVYASPTRMKFSPWQMSATYE